jgi:nucleotide-binding universal stress UspA family protein
VNQIIESGAPAETICAQAEERNADLVVVGSRGMGAVGRWLLGSVSDRVVHLSKRPVVVAR